MLVWDDLCVNETAHCLCVSRRSSGFSGGEGEPEEAYRARCGESACRCMFYLLSLSFQHSAPPFNDLLSHSSLATALRKCVSVSVCVCVWHKSNRNWLCERYMRIYDVKNICLGTYNVPKKLIESTAVQYWLCGLVKCMFSMWSWLRIQS